MTPNIFQSLHLEHFRNHQAADFSFAPLTVITGPNGSGKTSILEAIAMLSLTTSWKTDKDSEVISFGESFTRIIGGDMELVIQRTPYLKRMRIDGVSKRVYQVVGYFPTVLFQPDDLQLLYGAPAFRRHYLDRILSQCNASYTRAIVQLQSVLKQRNRLLKNIQEGVAREEELVFWDVQLAELQALIQPQRAELVTYINQHLPRLFEGMVPGTSTVNIQYITSPLHLEKLEHSFLEHLAQNRVKEIAAGSSLYGPQREDIHIQWGEHPAEQAMSRGQSRSLLLALKIVELGYISDHTDKKPVLLLDDIFSELDAERRERLFDVFGDYQVIMTTTELGPVAARLGEGTAVIEL